MTPTVPGQEQVAPREYSLLKELCMWILEIEKEVKYNDTPDDDNSCPVTPHFMDFCDEIAPTNKTYRKHETKLLRYLNQILTLCEEVVCLCEKVLGWSIATSHMGYRETQSDSSTEVNLVRLMRKQLECRDQDNVVKASRIKLSYHIAEKASIVTNQLLTHVQNSKSLKKAQETHKESNLVLRKPRIGNKEKLQSLQGNLHKQVFKLKSLAELLSEVLAPNHAKPFAFRNNNVRDNIGHRSAYAKVQPHKEACTDRKSVV